jgi:penicillin-binding protein 1A
VLIEKTSAERSVIKESTAWLLTSAMEDVVTQGTGTACQLDNMPVAGKTGTTESYNDLWFVGYTPYYTCAVWSGYDNNENLPEDARNFHKQLWKRVMERIHENLPYQDFEMPSSIEKISVCSETGLLPRAGCDVITEYFDVGNIPEYYCEEHFYDEDDYDEDEELTPTPTPEEGEIFDDTYNEYTDNNYDDTYTEPDNNNDYDDGYTDDGYTDDYSDYGGDGGDGEFDVQMGDGY